MTFRWAIIGHGHVSGRFRDAVDVVDGAEVVAVAGRNAIRARDYAIEHAIASSYGSVEALLDAGGVDAAYICTPHTAHVEAALACIAAKVPVLVEKPMSPTLALTGSLVAAALEAEVFAMEAMWTRFLPIYSAIRSWIDSGRIGAVRSLKAASGFHVPLDPEHRLFSPQLAGGSILDVGVYPIGLAHWLYGSAPAMLHARGLVGCTGVDEHVTMEAEYGDGQHAYMSSSVRSHLDGCDHMFWPHLIGL